MTSKIRHQESGSFLTIRNVWLEGKEVPIRPTWSVSIPSKPRFPYNQYPGRNRRKRSSANIWLELPR
jgi:hypothetical protein